MSSAAVLVLASASGAAADGPECRSIDTEVEGVVDLQSGRNTASIHDGYLKGSLEAQFIITDQIGDVYLVESSGEVATKGGALSLHTSGTLSYITPTDVAFEASGPVTGGTGKFVGATGELVFSGTSDLAAGTFTEHIVGTVCKLEDHD